MEIIQSYGHLNEGSPYLKKSENNKKVLNFYSFLLSYFTLKKYYGKITMYCDKKGHELLVKYIPYDKINLIENENNFKFWSYYKVDIIKQMSNDFIHVDSDVFIFDDLFSSFINSNNYDAIVQDKIPKKTNYSNTYVNLYKNYLIKDNIFDPKLYDGRCYSCGTVGLRMRIKDDYIQIAEAIKKGFMTEKKFKINYIGMVCEELALYLSKLKFGFKVYEILPHKSIIKNGPAITGNMMKYTHMYLETKYMPNYVKLIRSKVIKEFPEAINYIEKYEKDVMKNSKYLKEICT